MNVTLTGSESDYGSDYQLNVLSRCVLVVFAFVITFGFALGTGTRSVKLD